MDQPANFTDSDPYTPEQPAIDQDSQVKIETTEQQAEPLGATAAEDAPDAPGDTTTDVVSSDDVKITTEHQDEQQPPAEDTVMDEVKQEAGEAQGAETNGVNTSGAETSSSEQQLSVAEQETAQSDAMKIEPKEKAQSSNMETQQELAHPANPTSSSFFNTPASWQIPPSALQQRPDNEANDTSNKANLRRERLKQRIADDEYDVAAWTNLINEIQQTGDLAATRDVYERFLKIFPTSPKHWLAYLELELSYSNFNEVEALFTRCLKTVLSVDLWKFYLGYIRRINQGDSGSSATPEARGIIEKAYEYVLNNVGIDKDAGPIWADYIYFMSTAETTNTWEEQRKMDSMRRAYQKAVTIPLNNIEHLWKEYDQWENNLNRLTAKKFLGEKSSAYMTARAALREMKSYLDQINRLAVPKPPQWSEKEIEQLNLWKQYIQWEKKNPLQLEDENLLNERVAYAYQQAFLSLRLYPEIWYDYANYYMEQGKQDRALAILKQSLEVLPNSLLLTFAYTELCETRRQLDDARQAFDSLLEHLEKDIEKHTAAAQAEIEKIQKAADEERANMNLSDDIDGEVREQLRTREKQVKKEQEEVENKMKEKVNVLSRACSLVWICYMRFARRTEGIKAARALFSRARKATNRTYHVFIASALMEYHNSKDSTVAGKIFGLGLKLFADDAAYVSHYLDYLMQMNDDNNTRALFERTLATMPASKAAPIWDKFLDYENKYGDLASIQSVEKRRSEVLPETAASSFLQRYSYLDIDAIKELELGGQGTDRVVAVPTATAAVATAAPPTTQKRSKDASKRPLLEPVDVDKYPRPDLSQWQSFKPSELRRPPPVPVSGPPPPPVPIKEMDVDMTQPASGHPLADTAEMLPPPAPMPAVNRSPNAPPPGPLPPLPEPVAFFVSHLPPANTFNGPIIKAGELVDLLRNVIIPLPPQGAPPPHGRMPPQPMPPPSGRRDMPTNRGGYSGSPVRGRVGGGGGGAGGGGGFKGRPGAGGGLNRGSKQGTKRRGRDDYDDDYQQAKGKKRFGP